jgi:hypothetical protein
MSDDGWLVAQSAQILALETEVKGMEAANHERLHRGESLAYSEQAFLNKADEIRFVAAVIMRYR